MAVLMQQNLNFLTKNLKVLIFILPALLVGCGGRVAHVIEHSDGPPAHYQQVDVKAIPDAVPQIEPKSRYGNPDSYVVYGRRYFVMPSSKGYYAQGTASWYGTKFHSKRTSSGEPYNMFAMTAAHKTLPLPTYAEVKNLENGRKIIVKINDRGPFHDRRLIDLSYAAAKKLDMLDKGTAQVQINAIDPYQWRMAEKPVSPPTQLIQTPLQATTEVAQPKSQLYLQVAAFSEHLNAQQFAQRIMQVTGKPVVIKQADKGKSLYRVQVGPINTIGDADQISQHLQQTGYGQPLVVFN